MTWLPFLNRLLKNLYDSDLVEYFLYFLRYDYLVPVDRNDLASSDPSPAVAKIMKALP